ncbi:hypothetical protein [Aeromicrobium sp. UC242_57]|uniref:hypothetical protein n=1 Tax=Aeromicrobium sp. UC242_57 TaxID=3374624 RepID=UPI00378AF8DE
MTISPEPGADTFGLLSTPGAIFSISHGIDYGADDVELIDCGVYEAAKGAVNLGEGGIGISLVDLWQRVERCRFLSAYYPASGTRAAKIAEAVAGAFDTVDVLILSQGGVYEQGDNLWERDRTQFIADMAKDGALEAAFDASGTFRIRTPPALDGSAPVWTFRTGEASNIVTADRERPLDRLYNTVVMQPMDDSQSWDQQTIVLADIDHPRHPSKIGVVPFFYKSATLNTPAEVTAAGIAIMQRVLGTTETVSITSVGNPALEVGDVVSVVHAATDTDPGFQATHLIDSFQMDLDTGAMSLATRSSTLADLEES